VLFLLADIVDVHCNKIEVKNMSTKPFKTLLSILLALCITGSAGNAIAIDNRDLNFRTFDIYTTRIYPQGAELLDASLPNAYFNDLDYARVSVAQLIRIFTISHLCPSGLRPRSMPSMRAASSHPRSRTNLPTLTLIASKVPSAATNSWRSWSTSTRWSRAR
jgi:hypothetical protein